MLTATPPGEFGPMLKTVRQNLALSQEALALRMQTTQRHLSFLETGRSAPTAAFLKRLCGELGLSEAQRINLFRASGLSAPYQPRQFSAEEIKATLDLIEFQVLENWRYPAFVLDGGWRVLRTNRIGRAFFAPFGIQPGQEPPNLMAVLLSDRFRTAIANWKEVCPAMYFRLQNAAQHDEHLAEVFEDAVARGIFADIPSIIARQDPAPPYIPVKMNLPGVGVISLTSFLGQLVSIEDALVQALEIEMMVPTDPQSADAFLAFLTACQAQPAEPPVPL